MERGVLRRDRTAQFVSFQQPATMERQRWRSRRSAMPNTVRSVHSMSEWFIRSALGFPEFDSVALRVVEEHGVPVPLPHRV